MIPRLALYLWINQTKRRVVMYSYSTRIAPVFVFVADARFPFTDQLTSYKEVYSVCQHYYTIRVNYKFGILNRIIH